MSAIVEFDAAFERCPLIAILRGICPDETEAIGEALVAAGFTLIEVPLNSPNPLESVERLAKRLAGHAAIGAGTVLYDQQIAEVRSAGGTMIISPNANPRVIAASAAAELVSLPGISTPTEAFAAIDAGANALKLFPAEGASPATLKAMRVVLPDDVRVLPVGGILSVNMASWIAAGAAGFGFGSALYRPGYTLDQVKKNAKILVKSFREIELRLDTSKVAS